MTASDAFSEYYADLLQGTYDCEDRVVLNAFFPLGQDRRRAARLVALLAAPACRWRSSKSKRSLVFRIARVTRQSGDASGPKCSMRCRRKATI
jgi:hypothetical protein